MKALTYTLELLEPLLIASPVSGDENSATGLDYIPGSVIRGAVAHAFTNGKRGDLNDASFKRLFFGDVLFLNAYPLIKGERGLPTPRSWHREKDARDTDPIFDLANGEAASNRQLKGLSQPFAHLQLSSPKISEGDQEDEAENEKPQVTVYAPERDVRVHILQEDRRNAVQKESGSIYRYNALAAGQRFGGAIVAPDESLLNQIEDLLGRIIRLGKSRSAGYGAVQAADLSIQPDWRECAPMQTGQRENIVVTLLSDAIIRDPQTGAYAGSLAPLFGGRLLHTFARTHVVGGFNLAWALPLAQAQAIQAGSVFVFERSDALSAQLQSAEAGGIGERRSDGFGRIAINRHTESEFRFSKAEPRKDIQRVTLTHGSAEQQLAQQMVNRMWRTQLDGALRNVIGQSKLRSAPKNTQLSRMRVLVREAWRMNNADLIREVLKEPDKDGSNRTAMKRQARDQFDKARISLTGSTQRLIDWLKTLADNPQTVWTTLQMDQLKRPEIGGVKAENPDALEYAARLVDGVLRKAAKEGGDE
jgi:CRISPR-associated protein Csx10